MKDTVIFSGEVIGEGQTVPCKVRATKTTLDGHPEIPPAYSGYHVMNSNATDRLPDGDTYEIHLANGERIRVKRRNGQFLARL